jgi:histidine ammonia-lyase
VRSLVKPLKTDRVLSHDIAAIATAIEDGQFT